MATKIFVNLPVKDLQRSVRFFRSMGFGLNPDFTDESTACIAVSEEIFVMLLTEAKFREATRRPQADSSPMTGMISLSVASRARVNQLVDRALAQGGHEMREPEDHGFMFGRSFRDLDGHVWEIIYMTPDAVR